VSRLRLLVALALLVPLGLLTKVAGPGLMRGYLGGVLYVVFWTYAALLARPAWPPARVALAILLATCAIEILQLWHPAWLERARATPVGGMLLGSTFDPWDFPCYAVGAAAVAAARALRA
jgi:hypothetical protein